MRLRINLAQRELEIEGSEEFVRQYQDRIDAMFAAFEATDPPVQERIEPGPANQDQRQDLESFGEFIQRLPTSATDVDCMLAAGYYVQQQSSDDAFTTADANRRLAEHGVKIGNPSQCVKQSLLAKRVFMVQRGRYRVSQNGRVYLRQSLNALG